MKQLFKIYYTIVLQIYILLSYPVTRTRLSHHFPFCTDVRARSQNDQEACLLSQIQKMLQISVACEVVHPLYRFMEVPGHISVCQEEEVQMWSTHYSKNRNIHVRMLLNLHLDGIESGHVHLHEPVLPVVPWDSGVVNTAWDVLKGLVIFEETVVFVVYREWSFSRDLWEKTIFLNWFFSITCTDDIYHLPARGVTSVRL